MEYKDYYKILGVERNASQDEIKRAYRKLARKYHPDVSAEADAEDRFKEVQEAYEVLKDPEKRTAYDQLGSGWQSGQDFTPPPGWERDFSFHGGGFTEVDPEEFSEFFENLFGGGFGGRRSQTFHRAHGGRARRGADQRMRIPVTLEESYSGAEKRVRLQFPSIDQRTGRRVNRTRTLNVKIPKGVTHGQVIRLSGQGEAGDAPGAAGDLLLEVDLQPHSLYRVEGKDLYLTVPVTPWEAALGSKIEVPTPGGEVEMTIPPGTRSGERLRLKGRGLPGRTAGDQYVILQIQTPRPKTDEQKRLYEEMARKMPYNPRVTLGG